MAKFKFLTNKLLLSLAVFTAMGTAASFGTVKASAAEVPMKSSKQIVDDMGVGWNLGNSLDSNSSWLSKDASPLDHETSWGNPVTTKEMMDKVKEGGFKTIRIPVTWGTHVGPAPDYKIDPAWMNRVKQVVNFVVDNRTYAIINMHHENEWVIPSYAKETEVTDKIQKVWKQIAAEFKDYDDHLLFETLNEPRETDKPDVEWNGGTEQGRTVINHYNAAAVQAIRSTGGNNDERSILVPTYAAASYGKSIEDIKIPDSKNIIVSVHSYFPYAFAMDTNKTSQTDKWGSDSDKQQLNDSLDGLYNRFVKNGTPVIIGEMGTTDKRNDADRARLSAYYISSAKQRHIPCILWDNNAVATDENYGEKYGLFNRSTLNWHFPEIHNAIINAYNSTSFKDIK